MATPYDGAAEPPEGIEPNFDDPPSQLNGNIALHTTFLVVVTAAVSMRIYTRLFISRVRMGADDYLCLISYAFTINWSVFMFKAYLKGIGRHMWDIPVHWVSDAFKWTTIASFFYILLSTTIKLAFLCLYRRLFSPETKYKYFITGGMVVVVCLGAGVFFSSLFACVPTERIWDETVDGYCNNPDVIDYLSGAVNSATDLYIFILPMPFLWGLKMGVRRKLKLSAIFGLGFFACLASLLRLGQTPVIQSSPDLSWNISTIGIWATIEVNVGLICACLMMLPAFLDRHLPPAVSESAARLWSYARDLTSRGRSSRGASLDDGRDDWPGYRQTAASGSQRLVKVDSKKQILRRESFSLETMPRDSSHRHTDSNKVTVESTNV